MINSRYDWKKIGQRLESERTNKGLSLQAMEKEENIGITRQTLRKWEKGEGCSVDIFTLIKLANFFDCEIGYLLCEYDCKTREKTDIQKVTGLNEKAIEALQSNEFISIINTIILDPHFKKILEILSACSAQQLNTSQSSIIKDRIKSKLSETSKISDGTSKVLYDISKYGLPVLYKQIVLDETSKLFDSVINKL